MAFKGFDDRVAEYMEDSLGSLIKQMAKAAVEDFEYQHSSQHFSQVDYIEAAIDRKYGALLSFAHNVENRHIDMVVGDPTTVTGLAYTPLAAHFLHDMDDRSQIVGIRFLVP